MKLLLLLSLVSASLLAQIEPGQKYYLDLGNEEDSVGTVAHELTYEVVKIHDTKTLLFHAKTCVYGELPPALIKAYLLQGGEPAFCLDDTESEAEAFSAVGQILAAFYSQYPDGQQWYIPFAKPGSVAAVHPHLATAPPSSQPIPRMIFLDGLGNSLLALDMTTFAVVSQVVVPSTVGPFGIRPTATGPDNEVWVVNSGVQVSVVDLGAQRLLTNIPTPSIPPGVAVAGIVFTRSGATALEAVRFFTPDAAGNKGALLTFDAVSRKLTSTLLLKSDPSALLMAPDGLTAYLLDQTSAVTYYDLLSGTADLTASTFSPGLVGGYNPAGQVYIHPDGSRLLWSAGGALEIFDLTTRKVTQRFSFGLPSTIAAGAAMSMSQDGGRVYVSDVLGDVVIIDTQYGHILLTYNTGEATSVLGGAPLAR